MFAARVRSWSLQLEQTESSRMVWAFVISLAIHLLIFATYEIGSSFNLWQRFHLPAWMQQHKKFTELLTQRKSAAVPAPDTQVPLLFVEVNPTVATPEPPKEAKYYANKNSLAANPNADKDLDVPKIEGTQTKEIKTETVPRQKQFTSLQPAPPPAPPKVARTEQPAREKPVAKPEESKPKPPEIHSDLAMAKLEPPKKEEAPSQSRPRTIKEALARLHQSQTPGQAMRQDGGVKRYLEIGSLDAKGSVLGEYDQQLIAMIKEHWLNLLDARGYASDARGKVVLQFSLHPDGTVTNLRVAESTAGVVLSGLCERAVWDPSPFPKWPAHMRRMLGDTRDVQFTFYYY